MCAKQDEDVGTYLPDLLNLVAVHGRRSDVVLIVVVVQKKGVIRCCTEVADVDEDLTFSRLSLAGTSCL